MIQATFYRFSKKENSTARPVTGRELYVELKDASSIFYPIIKLNRGASTAPTFNYCHIPDFNRYYYITEWVWNLGIWEATLKCDVLATYKTVIGDASLYALRAANSYDGSIPDHLYPTKTGCSFDYSTSWTMSGAGGFGTSYILGVVSDDPDFGSITYYAVNSSNLASILSDLLDDSLLTDNGFNVADASIPLQKSIVDPIQYIKSAIYLPFTLNELSNLSTVASQVKIFNWELSATAKTVRPPTPVTTVTHSFTIPKHPQTSARGNFVNQSPYSFLTLYAPPFGNIELDTTAFANASTVDISLKVDMPTGLGILEISNGSYITNRIEASVGVPIQLSQVSRDYVGAAVAGISAIGGAIGGFMSGNVGGAISSAASGIGNAVSAMAPKAQTIGSGGSYAQVRGGWYLEAQFFTIVNDDISHNGRPLCQMIQPKNINGYMLIQDGDVAIDGTQEESVEIKRYLESGFYYE